MTSVAPTKIPMPTVEPKPIPPTPTPTPMPTPTPQVTYHPITTPVPKPFQYSVDGKVVVDARDMIADVQAHGFRAYLMDKNEYGKHISFHDPSVDKGNTDVKMYITNPSHLAMYKNNGKQYWVVNQRVVDALGGLSGTLDVPINTYGDMFSPIPYNPSTSENKENLSIYADHSFLHFVLIILLLILFYSTFLHSRKRMA